MPVLNLLTLAPGWLSSVAWFLIPVLGANQYGEGAAGDHAW
jgi:hypothetical protein